MNIKNPYRFAKGGINSPTDIDNCVLWLDFSDSSYMFGIDPVVSFTDKVAGAVFTRNSTTTEMKWATTHLIKKDDTPIYNAVFASPITCNNYTVLHLFQHAGTAAGGNLYLFNYVGLTSVPSRLLTNLFKFKSNVGINIFSTSQSVLMTEPHVIGFTGGINEGVERVYWDNTQESSQNLSKNIIIDTQSYCLYSNRSNYDLRPYQTIIYDRVLTSEEMVLIHEWLETKK